MPSTAELNPVGQVYETFFKEAWNLFRAEQYDQANELCRDLLQKPDLGHLHKAGLHLILAHSPDQYVFHAQQAVLLYKTLYDENDDSVTPKQRSSQQTLLSSAQKVLKKCLKDAVEVGEDEDIDEDALKQDLDAAMEKNLANELNVIQSMRAREEEMEETLQEPEEEELPTPQDITTKESEAGAMDVDEEEDLGSEMLPEMADILTPPPTSQ